MSHANCAVAGFAEAVIGHDQQGRIFEHLNGTAKIHAMLGEIAIGFGVVPFVFHDGMIRVSRMRVNHKLRTARMSVKGRAA